MASVTALDALSDAELLSMWESAQGSAGVLAVEPETARIGRLAAQKKTWTVADRLLKFFVYGDQPNWFPADVVRRTVCGPLPRWSSFWHPLSGAEHDLHPWLDGAPAFAELAGPGSTALVGSGALDLASCEEVGGAAAPCLYGEVTPTQGFESWFCGGEKAACWAALKANRQAAPPDFRDPEQLCMHGPWVLERVHAWRPEIHPAEVLWARKPHERGRWIFALIPDNSGRFDKRAHFEASRAAEMPSFRPWSSERPVELWVAFEAARGRPLAFDLAMKVLGKRSAPARQVTLTPPVAGGPFVVLPHGLEGVLAVAKVWANPAGGPDRGFLVLRTSLRKNKKEALVLRLGGRGVDEPSPPAEIEGVAAAAGLVAPVAPAAVEPAVRLFGVARLGPSVVPGAVAVNTLVRFDPKRPTEPEDERATDRLNDALKGKAAKRRQAFGTERPFRVEWDLSAVRNDTGEPVPVDVPGGPQSGGPLRVSISSFPGPATSTIVVNGHDPSLALGVKEATVSLGQLLVRIPAGVTLAGTGRVVYVGSVPLDQPTPAARLSLRVPARRYPGPWELVSDVLAEIDPASAGARLLALREAACAPAPASDCTEEPLAPQVAARLADPAARWSALADLREGDRPFARFVWLFARALSGGQEVTDDERALLKRLLEARAASSVVR